MSVNDLRIAILEELALTARELDAVLVGLLDEAHAEMEGAAPLDADQHAMLGEIDGLLDDVAEDLEVTEEFIPWDGPTPGSA